MPAFPIHKYLLFLLLLTTSTAVIPDVTDKELDFSDDITLLKSALMELHPGYRRYIDEKTLNANWDTLAAQSQNTSVLTFYSEVSDVLSDIRCEHTKAELPENYEKQKKANMLPFTVKIFDNNMFIDKNTLSLSKGTEILSINEVTSADILARIRSLVAIDGYTEHTIDRKIEQDFDLVGSNLEEFLAPAALGLDEYPSSYTLSVRENDVEKVITVSTIDFQQWIKMAEVKYRKDFKDSVFLEIDDELATLTVDTFVNYRQPVDPDVLFDGVFEQIRNAKVQHLIVDLRNNGGGSDDAQLALMRHLFNSPFRINDAAWVANKHIRRWKDKITTWDDTVFSFLLPFVTSSDDIGRKIPSIFIGDNYELQKPAANAFTGRITVLTSKNNASASAGMLAHMQKQPHIRLVGEPTGGNQGGVTASMIGFLKLPKSGITVRIPLIRNRYAIDDAKDGVGVEPDVLIEASMQDWLLDRDAAMQFAKSN